MLLESVSRPTALFFWLFFFSWESRAASQRPFSVFTLQRRGEVQRLTNVKSRRLVLGGRSPAGQEKKRCILILGVKVFEFWLIHLEEVGSEGCSAGVASNQEGTGGSDSEVSQTGSNKNSQKMTDFAEGLTGGAKAEEKLVH